MKHILLIILLLCTISVQGSVTFKVETLTKPDKPVPMVSADAVFRKILDAKIRTNDHSASETSTSYNIVAQNKIQDSLVSYGQHAFFEGIRKAYSDHRPIVLSPDMIWLLICQGFSQHVNNNAERLRHLFVKHDGKMVLTVVTNSIKLDDPESPWETVFPEFTKQIDAVVGKELVSTLTCDFSTTTAISRVASQITIMEAMQAYFEYYQIYISCGIPEITLEGSPQDWQKIIEKTQKLRSYDLEWWVDALMPVLKQFKKTAEGRIDLDFWKSIYIKPSSKTKAGCGIPDKIDGWIVTFFPYDNDGKRNSLELLTGSSNLPMELACVDLEYIEKNALGVVVQTVPLELWAGFVGLKQQNETFALTPQIGWMVRKKDLNDDISLEILDKAIAAGSSSFKIGVSRLSKPFLERLILLQKNSDKSVLTNFFRINANALDLTINFFNKIELPADFYSIGFSSLRLNGVIENQEIERILESCKNVRELYINGNKYKGLTR